MRLLTAMIFAGMLAGCAVGSRSYVDDRPPIGVQQPKPMCSSGPGGKTAACVSAIIQNAAIHNVK